MPYTDACVREAARLVPSAHGVFRKAKKDLQVLVCVHVCVCVSVWCHLHTGCSARP